MPQNGKRLRGGQQLAQNQKGAGVTAVVAPTARNGAREASEIRGTMNACISQERRATKTATNEASSRGSSPRVVICHLDTAYRSNEPIYASQAYLRVPMVNIDGGTMSSSSNAGPAEGKV